MKVTSFHFMPYRELPSDFTDRYSSSFIDVPWWELGDADKVTDSYNWSIDELMKAAEMGFDGVGTNEHHQNVYGFMCNPNLFGAILAKNTRDKGWADVAIVQLGATAVATSPPIRLAEEYAVLDCISGGRLIAGFPLGLAADANISYGVVPIEQRERWYEALELVLKSWQADDYFAWNGKYWQLPRVNLWPRPVQKPHPPLLIPGAASSSTWEFCHQQNLPYAMLSYFGRKSAENVLDRFFDRAEANGRDRNPYRATFLQLIGVAETDELAFKQFSEHVEYFYQKLLHQPPQYNATPGYSDYKSLVNLFKNPMFTVSDLRVEMKKMSAEEMIEKEFALVGSPERVADKLEEMCRRLNIGHLMTVLQFGSMPHELSMKNIELFGREVLPRLRPIWDEEGWKNEWWPAGLTAAPERSFETKAEV